MEIRKRLIVDIPFNIDFSFVCKIDARSIVDYKEKMKLAEERFRLSQEEEWIDYRLAVFMKYTVNSLVHQKNQDFICIVRCSEQSKAIIDAKLEKYPPLPQNIIFTTQPHQEIARTLVGFDYLYHIRIDSDNMYDDTFIDKVNKVPYEHGLECILCQYGYLYDDITGRIGKIYHHSPSLYVYICKSNEYCGWEKDAIFFGNHFRAEWLNKVVLHDYNFLIVTHIKNLNNEYDMISKCFGVTTITDEKEKTSILQRYHLLDK